MYSYSSTCFTKSFNMGIIFLMKGLAHMKKNVLGFAVIGLSVFCGLMFYDGVSAAQTSSTSTTGSSKSTVTKKQLDTLAMSALKEAEKRNNKGMRSYIYQMMEKGVTAITTPQVVAKRTPQCPPIKMDLNGRKLSGSVCARMSYEYNNKEYWVGYCK